jgi:hypothetical protein
MLSLPPTAREPATHAVLAIIRVAAAARVADLAGYPHGAGADVDVSDAERGKFSPSKACEGGQQHERPIAWRDGVGQGVDLGNGQDRAFR